MIIVSANPWEKNIHSINIGKICANYGGGGHPTAGGINVDEASEAQKIAEEIIAILKNKINEKNS
ncbi:MAG TPA: hypothetical protein ENG63_04220 [Candidatus Desulfofervidus auxilii]|nr:hypothetical protein [Candidatus Desulfofervidus auxilii]